MSRYRQRNVSSVPKRIFHKTIILILVIGIPVAAFLFAFDIKNVNVVGSKRYTTEQITNQLIQTKQDHNLLYLYLKYSYFEDASIPFVEKIELDITDNHSLTVYVYEKMISGCVEFMGEYLYFDKDGIVIESSSKQLEDVPMINGLEFSKIVLNEKLVVQNDELFDIIIDLAQLIDKFELDVDTITINTKNEITFDCGDITILLGEKSTYDEVLSQLKNILKEADGMKITLDMRNYVKGTDTVIAKPKKTAE